MTLIVEFDLMRNCGGFRSSYKALGAKMSALRSRAALASTASTDTSIALAMLTGTSTRSLMIATKKLLGFRTEGSYTYLTPAPMRPDIAIRAHSLNDAGAGATAPHVEAVSRAVIDHVLSVHADNKRTAEDRAAGEKRDMAQNAADAEIVVAKKRRLQLLLAQLQGGSQNSDGAKHIIKCISACEAEAAQLNKNRAAIGIQYKATNASTLLHCQTKAVLQKLIDGPRSVAGTHEGNTVRKEFVARQATDPDLDLSVDYVTGDENQNEKRRSLEVISTKTGGVIAGTSAVTIGTNMPMKLGLAFGAHRTLSGFAQFAHRVDRERKGGGLVLCLHNRNQWAYAMQVAVARVSIAKTAADNAGQGRGANARPAVLNANEAERDLAELDATTRVLWGNVCHVRALNVATTTGDQADVSKTCIDVTSNVESMCSVCGAHQAGVMSVDAFGPEDVKIEFATVLAGLPTRFSLDSLTKAIKASTALQKHFKRANNTKLTGRKALLSSKTVAWQFILECCMQDRQVELPPVRKRPVENPEFTSTNLSFKNPKARFLVQTEGLQSYATGTMPPIVPPPVFSSATHNETFLPGGRGEADSNPALQPATVVTTAAIIPKATGRRKKRKAKDAGERATHRTKENDRPDRS